MKVTRRGVDAAARGDAAWERRQYDLAYYQYGIALRASDELEDNDADRATDRRHRISAAKIFVESGMDALNYRRDLDSAIRHRDAARQMGVSFHAYDELDKQVNEWIQRTRKLRETLEPSLWKTRGEQESLGRAVEWARFIEDRLARHTAAAQTKSFCIAWLEVAECLDALHRTLPKSRIAGASFSLDRKQFHPVYEALRLTQSSSLSPQAGQSPERIEAELAKASEPTLVQMLRLRSAAWAAVSRLETVIESASGSFPENPGNTNELFAAVRAAVDRLEAWVTFHIAVNVMRGLRATQTKWARALLDGGGHRKGIRNLFGEFAWTTPKLAEQDAANVHATLRGLDELTLTDDAPIEFQKGIKKAGADTAPNTDFFETLDDAIAIVENRLNVHLERARQRAFVEREWRDTYTTYSKLLEFFKWKPKEVHAEIERDANRVEEFLQSVRTRIDAHDEALADIERKLSRKSWSSYDALIARVERDEHFDQGLFSAQERHGLIREAKRLRARRNFGLFVFAVAVVTVLYLFLK